MKYCHFLMYGGWHPKFFYPAPEFPFKQWSLQKKLNETDMKKIKWHKILNKIMVKTYCTNWIISHVTNWNSKKLSRIKICYAWSCHTVFRNDIPCGEDGWWKYLIRKSSESESSPLSISMFIELKPPPVFSNLKCRLQNKWHNEFTFIGTYN